MTDFREIRVSLWFIYFFALTLGACSIQDRDEVNLSFYQSMVEHNSQVVTSYLEAQERDPESMNYGGFADRHDIHNPGSTAAIFQRLAVAFASDSSEYFNSDTLLQSMQVAIDFLLRKQHEDGTIDLVTTNFHSTPDLGFAIEPMCLSYKILQKNGMPDNDDLMSQIRLFILNGAEALSVGGIHTPNHRWVVSMALSRIHDLFPNEKYKERVETWLNEGIDIDGDGQYTERSTSVYSPLTDRCLITIARIMDKPELYDPVRKNLEMTLYYVHPNGEVVTEASRRQDQYQAKMPSAYYYPYRYMMHLDQNSVFGAMVQQLEDKLGPELLSGDLAYHMEAPALFAEKIPGKLPTFYEKHFEESELIRIREGNTDATILAKNPAIFTMRKGEAALEAVRLSSAFFGKGQMKADTMLVEGDGYLLQQHLEGPYYQPFPVDGIPDDGSWEKMDRQKRPKSEIQELEYKVRVTRSDSAFQLHFSVIGTAHVPLALELAFRNGGELDQANASGHDQNCYFLPEGYDEYRYGGSTIRFGPGKKEHAWTQLRGAEDKLDAMSVYITGYTPFEYTLELR